MVDQFLLTHETSRALDPHLHTHCIVFNATHDSVENRWKALQNHELLRARMFARNAYYHELASELKMFGYRIRNQARGDFQIDGVPEELCERFSKRHSQIDEWLAKLLAEKPELGGANVQAWRARLAETDRARKQKDLSRQDLSVLWKAQLNEAECVSLRQSAEGAGQVGNQDRRISVAEAVQWAEEHLYDRNSVVPECQVWQEALGRARGEGFSVSELKDFTQRRGYIRDADRPGEVTLREVLLREWEIVQTVKEGVGDCHPLVANPLSANPALDDEQRKALEALLCSTNTSRSFV